MNTKTDTATPASPLVEDVRVAMRKAFHFGQTYWQQSDSESVSQNSKSDETATKFRQLVTDTCDALAAGIAQPAAQVEAGSISDDIGFPDVLGEFVRNMKEGKPFGTGSMALTSYIDQWHARIAVAQPAAPSDAAPASTLTQSRDRALWTDEQRENHRKNLALVYSCTVCCARKGEPHLPSCSEQGICGA